MMTIGKEEIRYFGSTKVAGLSEMENGNWLVK